jgi:hypothetical protein
LQPDQAEDIKEREKPIFKLTNSWQILISVIGFFSELLYVRIKFWLSHKYFCALQISEKYEVQNVKILNILC